MNTMHTRPDAEHYVRTALQDWAYQYDVEAILEDLHDQAGHWNFTLLDDEACTVDFWATVQRHELPVSPDVIPGCPDWCRLDKGHEYEQLGPDGSMIGYHEGTIAEVQGDGIAPRIYLVLVQQVTRDTTGTVHYAAPYVGVRTIGETADFTDPHQLRDLGDAVRAAAGKLEQIGQQ